MPDINVNGTVGKQGGTPEQLHGSQGEQIHIVLTQQDSSIDVTGTHAVSFATTDTLSLSARGGDGAPGIIGADGTPGTDGRNGIAATSQNAGTNGGDGGKGGPGAPGGDGGHAGNGGYISVTVRAEDMALLAAIDTVNVSAGTRGSAGQHGKGGPGGRGGRGGASCSWQEAYQDSEIQLKVHHHHHHHHGGHHHQGHGHHHTHVTPRVVPVTSYRTMTMPGGLNGLDGSPGKTDDTPLHAGNVGLDGKVEWRVQNPDGSLMVYPTRYRIQLQPPILKTNEEKGMFEPWEPVYAFYSITNTGRDMPTPSDGVPVVLQPVPGLRLIQDSAMVWGNLAPQQTGAGGYPAQFMVEGPMPHEGSAPWSGKVTLVATPYNQRLGKPFPGTVSRQEITVRYPVMLQPKPAHYAIAAGEKLTLEAEVYNLATRALGCQWGRGVMVEFVVPEGAREDEPRIQYLDVLVPQMSHPVTRTFTFSGELEEGTQKTFETKLFLQPYDRQQEGLGLIQKQTFTVQFTPLFSPPVPGGFLLVMNAETSPEMFAAWRSLLRDMAGNDGVAVWNASYYRGFAPDRVPEGFAQDLLSMSAERTVVILDNPWRATPQSQASRDSSRFTAALLERANRDTRTSVVVVSNAPTPVPAGTLPAGGPNNALPHTSIDMLVQTLFTDTGSLTNHCTLTLPLSMQGCWPFNSRRTAGEEMQSVNALLRTLFPHRRYQVRNTHSTHEELTLSLRRLSDPYPSNGLHQLAPTLTGEFTVPRAQMLALMPFEQKLKLFARTTPQHQQALARALRDDLLDEQHRAGQAQTYGSLIQRMGRVFARDFTQELERLHTLVRTLQGLAQQGLLVQAAAWRPQVIAVLAAVQFEVEQHTSFWIRLLHWFVPQTSEQLRESTRFLCEQAQTALGGQVVEAVGREMERLAFAQRLERFVAENNRAPGFFQRPLPVSSRSAATEMLRVCRGEVAGLSSENEGLFAREPALAPWYNGFHELFPEKLTAATPGSSLQQGT